MRALVLLMATSAFAAAGCDPDLSAATTSSGAPATTTSATATSSATASAARADDPADRASLFFAIEGKPVRSLERRELTAKIEAETFTAYDPYYQRPKTFRALPLRAVLEIGFAGRELALEAQHYVLRATDGYTVPVDGSRLLEKGGYIAIDDVDTADGWEPLGRRQIDPGPYYVVWRGDEQLDLSLIHI